MTAFYEGKDVTIHCGDCREVMAAMPENSVDAVVCDPPAGIGFMSNAEISWDDPDGGEARVRRANCLGRVFADVNFPNLNQRNVALPEESAFTLVIHDPTSLHVVDRSQGVNARVTVPVGSVDLQRSVELGQPEIQKSGESAVGISKDVLPFVLDVNGIELRGDYVLQLRRDAPRVACKEKCCCYRQFGLGLIGVPVIVAQFPDSDHSFLAKPQRGKSGRSQDVLVRDDSSGKPFASSGVVAGSGAVRMAMLCLDLRNASAKLLPADSAGNCHLVLFPLAAQTIRTNPGTSCLTTESKSSDVGKVGLSADGASPLGCRIFAHRARFYAICNAIQKTKPFLSDWRKFCEREPNASGKQTEEWDESGGASGTRPFARKPTPRYRGKNKASLQGFQDFIAECVSKGIIFGADRKKTVENDYTGEDGLEEVEAWECAPDCPVRMLDDQVGDSIHSAGAACGPKFRGGNPGGATYSFGGRGARVGDSGAVSRFFYVSKADSSERVEHGADQVLDKNGKRVMHATVKNLDLMRWLVRLVSPPPSKNGVKPVVLDPFMGSGSTLRACQEEHVRGIGIERNEDYCRLAKARLAQPGLF